MEMRKKAMMFEGIMFFIILIILVTAFTTLYKKQNKFPPGYIVGERQFTLIKVYQQAEKSLFYIDQSAKYALQQAIYDLANQGLETDCGTFNGINTLAVVRKEDGKFDVNNCFPSDENIKKNLFKLFDANLKEYLGNYPDAYISHSYIYDLKNNEIIGKAAEDLVIDIVPENFIFKAELSTTNPNEIYQQAVQEEIPEKLRTPRRAYPDIETVRQYHPEVWAQYEELCKRMGASSGVCKFSPTKCCITSGYRHPAYNKEIGGATNSPHQYGTALDIYVGKGKDEQLKWADAADDLFTRVGIYPGDTHIHVDLMPPKADYQLRYWIGHKGAILEKANSFAELQSKAGRFT